MYRNIILEIFFIFCEIYSYIIMLYRELIDFSLFFIIMNLFVTIGFYIVYIEYI